MSECSDTNNVCLQTHHRMGNTVKANQLLIPWCLVTMLGSLLIAAGFLLAKVKLFCFRGGNTYIISKQIPGSLLVMWAPWRTWTAVGGFWTTCGEQLLDYAPNRSVPSPSVSLLASGCLTLIWIFHFSRLGSGCVMCSNSNKCLICIFSKILTLHFQIIVLAFSLILLPRWLVAVELWIVRMGKELWGHQVKLLVRSSSLNWHHPPFKWTFSYVEEFPASFWILAIDKWFFPSALVSSSGDMQKCKSPICKWQVSGHFKMEVMSS